MDESQPAGAEFDRLLAGKARELRAALTSGAGSFGTEEAPATRDATLTTLADELANLLPHPPRPITLGGLTIILVVLLVASLASMALLLAGQADNGTITAVAGILTILAGFGTFSARQRGREFEAYRTAAAEWEKRRYTIAILRTLAEQGLSERARLKVLDTLSGSLGGT